MASIDRHRWTPPPGAPSVVELLREDRDIWACPPETHTASQMIIEEREQRRKRM